MTLLWWHWAVIGLGFMLAELLVPLFVLVWFGLGGLLVLLLVLALPEISTAHQILLWVAASLMMMGVWFRFFNGAHKTLAGRASAQFIGEVGMITETVAPFRNGKVRFQKPMVGSEVWDCIADEAIEIGARVKVATIEGNLVTVVRV